MRARQGFYVESLGESSTTSASEQVKTTLTCIPDANSDYWLIASGAFTCSSTTDNHEGQVDLWHHERPRCSTRLARSRRRAAHRTGSRSSASPSSASPPRRVDHLEV